MSLMNFDLAALRSLAIGMELGSFARAAERVGRSTSAVSAQIKKLEEQAGTQIFQKSGRGLALTEAGHIMLAYARRLIELNDEAATALRGIGLEGHIALGMQEDFGEIILPNVLGRFSRAHSKVRIQASVARHLDLMKQFTSNQLDLALVWGVEALQVRDGVDGRPLAGELLAEPEMCWIGSSSLPLKLAENEALPLVTFNGPCQFLDTATAALDRAGIPWRVVFTSPSLAGLWAAASAGLGLTVRTRYGLPATVAVVDPLATASSLPKLPRLPAMPLVLLRASKQPSPQVALLATIMSDALKDSARMLEAAA